MILNGKKILLDVLIKMLIIIALIITVYLSCTEIGRRLDQQAQAEHLYIQAYQSDLQANQTKE